MDKVIENGMLTLRLDDCLIASKVVEILKIARNDIAAYDEKQYNTIVVDMSSVRSIDSMGVTFVAGLYKTAASKQKDYKLVGLNKEIGRLFKTMKLNEIFSVECLV